MGTCAHSTLNRNFVREGGNFTFSDYAKLGMDKRAGCALVGRYSLKRSSLSRKSLGWWLRRFKRKLIRWTTWMLKQWRHYWHLRGNMPTIICAEPSDPPTFIIPTMGTLALGLGLVFFKSLEKYPIMQVLMYFSIFLIRWILIWLILICPIIFKFCS